MFLKGFFEEVQYFDEDTYSDFKSAKCKSGKDPIQTKAVIKIAQELPVRLLAGIGRDKMKYGVV